MPLRNQNYTVLSWYTLKWADHSVIYIRVIPNPLHSTKGEILKNNLASLFNIMEVNEAFQGPK